MDENESRYEVIFALGARPSAEPRRLFRWSWIKIGADGLVTVRGKVHATMRAAIDAAAEYRGQHGGGEIRVNLQDIGREDAQDAIYVS